MLEAAFWGFVAGAALLVGAVLGLAFHLSHRAIGLIMAFGAGTLISALTLELTADAYDAAGLDAIAVGLSVGALAFYFGDRAVDSRGGRHRKRSRGQQSEGAATGIALGAVLDGIPESVVIGISLLSGDGIGLAFVAAVFISNVPEALSASRGLRRAGRSSAGILGLWVLVALVSAVAAGLGYGLLGDAPADVVAALQAFAAGAILTMLADTMMPEAFEEAGRAVGLLTVLGYACGVGLTFLA